MNLAIDTALAKLLDIGTVEARLKQFLITLEENKNDSKITNPLLQKIDTLRTYDEKPENMEWLKELAELGNSYAQDYLGEVFYYDGVQHGEGDFEEAFRLFKLSANRGNSHAQYNLAHMYHRGAGCEKNSEKALELLEHSCGADCAEGKYYFKVVINDFAMDLYLENKQLKNKIVKLEEVNKKLDEENERLGAEVEYRPGGIGYEKAKEDAENLFSQIVKN